jgi:GT2 family glycosyltransferase
VTVAVSVVVPTADRPAQLAGCLGALGRLDHPRYEVLVIDDGGAADLAALCAAAGARLVRRERGGPGAARNTGAQAADGDVLAFTDDDCRPDAGWLRELLAAASGGAAVGGRTVNALTGNPYAAASQHVQDLVYAHYNRDPDDARFLASNNLAVPRADFLALGGFDADAFPFASEDRDLCDRWRASGRTLRYAERALVRHAHDLDLRSFLGQHVAYGRGAARYHAARATRGTGRLRDETSFHLDAALWQRTFGLRPVRRATQMAALLALWQVANAAGYGLERRRLTAA